MILEILQNEMKLQEEQKVFNLKWTAYRSTGYEVSYTEETGEKELKKRLYIEDDFTAETVIRRSGGPFETFKSYIENHFLGKYLTIIII